MYSINITMENVFFFLKFAHDNVDLLPLKHESATIIIGISALNVKFLQPWNCIFCILSQISRASIDACKDYFRDDLIKTDWQLMVELKKLFSIL